MGRWGMVLVAMLCLFGCHKRHVMMSPLELGSLARERGPATLLETNGRSFQLEPSSDLRFTLMDGRKLPWVSASKLATDGRRIKVDGRWMGLHEIGKAEVRSDDHVANLGLTMGGVAIVSALVVMAATKGKTNVSSPKAGGAAKSRSSAGLGRRRRGAFVDYRGQPEIYRSTRTDYLRVSGRRPFGPVRSSVARPLFSGGARRRFIFTPVLGARTGLSTAGPDSLSWDLSLGLRAANMWELQVGLRRAEHPFPEDEYSPWLVTMGMGGNFRLGGPVGFPLGLDFAFGDGGFRHFRIPYGLRLRFARRLDLILEPATPELSLSPELYGWGTHHGVKLSFAF
ncbi:MAG: hypothetical protein AAF851_04965 [Myxococcota bacterium]